MVLSILNILYLNLANLASNGIIAKISIRQLSVALGVEI